MWPTPQCVHSLSHEWIGLTLFTIYCDDNHTFYDFKLPYLRGTNDVDYVWLICALLVLVGNISVLVWRCTRRSDQRNSVPSILIINLATADLLLGIQMLLYLFLIAWPCSVFSHETVVIVFCDVSAWLQMVSTMMSSVTTTTIAFYFVISLTCSSHCSRKCIVALLLSEWMLLSCVSCSLAYSTDSFDLDFESIQCLPVSVTMLFYGGVMDFLLLIAVILYIFLLVKIKKTRKSSQCFSHSCSNSAYFHCLCILPLLGNILGIIFLVAVALRNVL